MHFIILYIFDETNFSKHILWLLTKKIILLSLQRMEEIVMVSEDLLKLNILTIIMRSLPSLAFWEQA
jgi:hypothetical protein